MRINRLSVLASKMRLLNLFRHPLTPVISLGFVAGLVATFIVNSFQVDTDLNKAVLDEALVSRLNELQTHLVALETMAGKSLPEIDLSSLEQKLKDLSLEVSELRQFNPDELKAGIESRLSETEKSLSSQLNHINSAVGQIELAKAKVKYLAPKALPFAVVSIDSIQNIPVASIQYDYKSTPMEVGDVLAGWKVVRVDFRHQKIEFENKQHEHVLLKKDNIG